MTPSTTSASAKSEDARRKRFRRFSLVPKPGQRGAGKRRTGLKTEYVDDRRRHVPQAHRLLDDLFGRAAPRRNDQERNVQLALIEAIAMAENARVLAEAFTVVRGDEEPGLLQNAARLELVKQLPDLLIEDRDAIVIRGGGKGYVPRRDVSLVQLGPILDQRVLAAINRCDCRNGGSSPAERDRGNGRPCSSGTRKRAAPGVSAGRASRGARD